MTGPFRDKTALQVLLEGQAEAQQGLVDASAELVGVMLARLVAVETRVFKLEELVREILQRTAGFGQRVGAVPIVDGEDRAKRVREDQAKGEDMVAPAVDLDGSKRPDTGGV